MGRVRGSHLAAAEKTRAELAELVPWVTDRQLQYWIEKGYVSPEAPGIQGHPRTFSDAEKRVLRTLARLTRAGMPAGLAARVARQAVTAAQEAGSGAAGVWLGGGLEIVIWDI